MTLLAFLVMVIVANHSAGDDIADFNGLGKRSPFLAFAMLMAMVSLAGLPFTAGFFGKFLVFKVALAQHLVLLAALGVITVACGFYYYLRVVHAMYFQPVAAGGDEPGTGQPGNGPRPGTENSATIPVGLLSRVTMAAMIVAIISLGIYPQPLLGLLSPVRAQSSTPSRVTPAATAFSLR